MRWMRESPTRVPTAKLTNSWEDNCNFLSKSPAIWLRNWTVCVDRLLFFKCIMCCPRNIGQSQNLIKSKLYQTFCSFGKRTVSTKFPVTEESWWPQFAYINGLLWSRHIFDLSFQYTRGVILFANTAQFAINDRQFPQQYHQHIITPPCAAQLHPSLFIFNTPFSTWSEFDHNLISPVERSSCACPSTKARPPRQRGRQGRSPGLSPRRRARLSWKEILYYLFACLLFMLLFA